MRIAVVGPTHPYKGGIAAHTTALAQHLTTAGHEVDLISWSRLYPTRLYPGEQTVPDGASDAPPYPRTRYPLRWNAPHTWWLTGRRLRGKDLVVVPLVVPAQVPALLTVLRAARAPSVVIAHNVLPHESHPGARRLARAVLRRADAVVVHSEAMARQARELLGADGLRAGQDRARDAVRVAELPPHLPGGLPAFAQRCGRAQEGGRRVSVLALGVVREYKGIDLLLAAAARVPDVEVTVAGEQWGSAGAEVRRRAGDPRLAGRVAVRPGYVAAHDIPALMRAHDVVALTYRSATASQNVQLAFAYGMPVLASDVGTFGAQVRDGEDGLLVPSGDVSAIETALRRLCRPGVLEGLQRGVRPVDLDAPWQAYLRVVLGSAADRAGTHG